jgi:hypothetical protein
MKQPDPEPELWVCSWCDAVVSDPHTHDHRVGLRLRQRNAATLYCTTCFEFTNAHPSLEFFNRQTDGALCDSCALRCGVDVALWEAFNIPLNLSCL